VASRHTRVRRVDPFACLWSATGSPDRGAPARSTNPFRIILLCSFRGGAARINVETLHRVEIPHAQGPVPSTERHPRDPGPPRMPGPRGATALQAATTWKLCIPWKLYMRIACFISTKRKVSTLTAGQARMAGVTTWRGPQGHHASLKSGALCAKASLLHAMQNTRIERDSRVDCRCADRHIAPCVSRLNLASARTAGQRVRCPRGGRGGGSWWFVAAGPAAGRGSRRAG
jgi:hypothetical protein